MPGCCASCCVDHPVTNSGLHGQRRRVSVCGAQHVLSTVFSSILQFAVGLSLWQPNYIGLCAAGILVQWLVCDGYTWASLAPVPTEWFPCLDKAGWERAKQTWKRGLVSFLLSGAVWLLVSGISSFKMTFWIFMSAPAVWGRKPEQEPMNSSCLTSVSHIIKLGDSGENPRFAPPLIPDLQLSVSQNAVAGVVRRWGGVGQRKLIPRCRKAMDVTRHADLRQ